MHAAYTRAWGVSAAAVLLACGTAAAEPVEFVDQTGRTVRLAAPAERVVTIPMPAASMFIAVDGGIERVAGMHEASRAAIAKGVLGDFFPGALGIRHDVAGRQFVPNVEALLAAEPDIVFQWADRGTDVITPMVEAGLNVAGLEYGTQARVEGWIGMMGAVAGERNKAGRLIDWQREARDDIRQQVAELDGRRPRVLYFLRFLSDMQVAAGGTYQTAAIELTGGKNPATELNNFPSVNVEQILVWDPQVILLNNFERGLTPRDVYDHPLLAGVSAVKNRRVYRMPLGGYRWDPPSHESPLAWRWLAMVINGEAVDYPLREEIRQSYGRLYGHTPSEAQIDAILHLDLHRGAAGYRRFER